LGRYRYRYRYRYRFLLSEQLPIAIAIANGSVVLLFSEQAPDSCPDQHESGALCRIVASMRITTRIVSSYGLFIAILAGLAAYQVITINRMQSINRALSGLSLQNGIACLQAMRDRDLVEEYALKSFSSGRDPDALEKLRDAQQAFEISLREISAHSESNEQLAEAERLAQLWAAYRADQEALPRQAPKNGTVPPESLRNHLEQLRAQTLSVYQAGLRSMTSEAEKSRRTAETAALVSGCAALVALASCILISLFVYRSIAQPLARLAEGTRAIAEGKLFYRLDTSRDDEFSQVARDFNAIADRLNERQKPG
jgi:methyl-accepting chemotaxis protein